MTSNEAPIRTRPFPAWPPAPTPEQEEALLTVLRSGKWGANQGAVSKNFAKDFASRHKANYGVCVSNGTISLTLCLRALGVRAGDEVIMPAFTFVATATSAMLIGAVPVFADIDPATMSMDAESVKKNITSRTKAIVPVHIAGCPADMDAILAGANEAGIPVIEDSAQAHGAEWRGTPVGALGNLGSFSFQASKNMTAGEGGAITTNSEKLYERVWSLHNVGRTFGGDWYQHDRVGWNFRLSEFQAAVLSTQLSTLDQLTERRADSAAYLTEKIATELSGLSAISIPTGVTKHAWHLLLLRFKPMKFNGISKTQLVAELENEGIPASAGYPALNAHRTILKEITGMTGKPANVSSCPQSELVSPTTFWLPQNVLLGEPEDLDDVISALKRIQTRAR